MGQTAVSKCVSETFEMVMVAAGAAVIERREIECNRMVPAQVIPSEVMNPIKNI